MTTSIEAPSNAGATSLVDAAGRRAAASAPRVETLGNGHRSGHQDASRRINIVLLGLTGSGKTTVGRLVANELMRPFVDNDSIVALRTGRHPDELAETAGIEALHSTEHHAFLNIAATSQAVVFASAASVIETVTADDLGGVWSVWLHASPPVLAERLTEDRPRPLLGATPESTLSVQSSERTPRARQLVQLVIDTDHASPAEVAAEVAEGWRAFTDRDGISGN